MRRAGIADAGTIGQLVHDFNRLIFGPIAGTYPVRRTGSARSRLLVKLCIGVAGR